MDQHLRGLFKTRQPEILYKELLESSQRTPAGAAVSLYFDLFTGDRRSALRHVAVPSLIVTTSENRANGEYMKARISRCSLEVIEDAGTAFILDKPQAFNQILEVFSGRALRKYISGTTLARICASLFPWKLNRRAAQSLPPFSSDSL